jgi:hypothetical protein
MRKLFLAVATVTIVSMVSLGSHRAEATVPGSFGVQAAAQARNSIQPVMCVGSAHAVCARCVGSAKALRSEQDHDPSFWSWL